MKINKFFKTKASLISLYLFAFSITLSFAQSNFGEGTKNIKEVANNITNDVLTSASTLLMTAAFVLFFAGVVMFIFGRVTGKGTMADIDKGKKFMMWGLGALFIMVSVWGIIKLAQEVLDIKQEPITIQPVTFGNIPDYSDSGSSGNGNSNVGGKPIFNDKEAENAKTPDNTKAVNTYTDTTKYPLILPGDYSTPKSSLASDGKALTLLYKLLYAKDCITDSTVKSFEAVYDPREVAYVEHFQNVNGLTVDGKVGPQTWEALSTKEGSKTSYGTYVLTCQGN